MAEKTLEEMTKEAEHVLALNDEGKSMDEISALLLLDRDYVYNILISTQGYGDDPMAVARMLMMEME